MKAIALAVNKMDLVEWDEGVYGAAAAAQSPWRLVGPGESAAGSAGEVGGGSVQGAGPAFWLFPLFLAAQGGHVQDAVSAAGLFGAGAEGRVGMENLVAVSEEAAESGLLTRLIDDESEAGCAKLALVPVIEHDRGDGGVERDVEVVVEVTAVGRVPGEVPAFAGFVDGDLAEWRARDGGEGRLASGQVAK